jgi:sec-independent protein translocase protein TatA
MPIGPLELVLIVVIILLIFGARRLPELGRSLGSGMREFKDSVSKKSDSGSGDAEDAGSEAAKPALESGPEDRAEVPKAKTGGKAGAGQPPR